MIIKLQLFLRVLPVLRFSILLRISIFFAGTDLISPDKIKKEPEDSGTQPGEVFLSKDRRVGVFDLAGQDQSPVKVKFLVFC